MTTRRDEDRHHLLFCVSWSQRRPQGLGCTLQDSTRVWATSQRTSWEIKQRLREISTDKTSWKHRLDTIASKHAVKLQNHPWWNDGTNTSTTPNEERAEHPSLQPDHTTDDREVRKGAAAEKQKAKDVNRQKMQCHPKWPKEGDKVTVTQKHRNKYSTRFQMKLSKINGAGGY